jgi:serine/threonine protein kinase
MSPELLVRNECEAAADLWSLGCILYFMLYGRGPFYHPCELELFNRIRNGKVDFPTVTATLLRAKE